MHRCISWYGSSPDYDRVWVLKQLLSPGFVLAESKQAGDCTSLARPERIKHLAKRIVAEKVDDDTVACYETLTGKEKASVFEAMATERGIAVQKLRDEVVKDKKSRDADNSDERMAGILWRQLIELPGVYAANAVPVTSYVQNNYCDGNGSDPDVDYEFRFDFPSPVTNPDALRSNRKAGFIGVDSMLQWYHVTVGGIDARGNTSLKYFFVCLGQNGVNTAGGIVVVVGGLRIQ